MKVTTTALFRASIVTAIAVGCGHGPNNAAFDAASTPAADAPPSAPPDAPIAPPLVDLTPFVDPLIGTADAPGVTNPVGGGAGGSVFPGATLPWGMIQFSPDTPHGSPSGYGYADTSITGFSVTHFSGAGCGNGGDLPFLAGLAPAVTAFPFQHAHEHASPGYYDVTSDDGIRVELTATLRTGLARVTFPSSGKPTLVVDASRSQTASKITAAQLAAVGTDGLAGYSSAGRFCGGDTFPIYFTVQFDHAWKSSQIANGKAVLSFEPGATVKMKIGVSFFSQANAKLNLDTEDAAFDFDAVRAAAKDAWNRRLDAIEIAGGTDDAKKMFYTALYHALIHPNVYSDVNGDFVGFERVNHQAPAGHVQYANFSGWDIYRSQVQLASLLYPDVWSDVVQSLVVDAQQCGAFPKWSQNNVEDNVMAGDPGSLIVANAYAFGATGFDTAGALGVMRAMTMQPGAACNGAVELPALDSYAGLGYVPTGWSASDTLEYAARDAAVAQFAAALGDTQLARITAARSTYWKNQLDTSANPISIQPRNADGTWPAPIAPADGFNNGFTEASAEQYGWYVPHDLRSLFDALGGNAKVVARLDAFFTDINAGGTSAYCYIGNEPDFTTPFLYDWAGKPSGTQDVVHRALSEAFSTAPGGLPGNDDLGATSSLIVWFMMGLYPEVPGAPGVAIASPSFASIKVHLPHDKRLQINATGTGHYVQSAKLDGAATSKLWLPVSTILAGVTLDFTLGATPSAWGSAPGDAPPSFGPPQVASAGDAMNSRGIAGDGAPDDGNFDGFGWSYSAEALAAAGASGATFTFGGVTFPWPSAGSALDNAVTVGQTIAFTSAPKGGKVAFLGAASAGPSTGTVTLRFTDGSTATAPLTFSDWTLGGGGASPAPGTQIAITSAYRHHATGQQDGIKTYVFYAAIPVDAGKTVASVTLPATVSRGRMHVFSVAVAP
jgi:predicted alpha-1,2-mannosidase